MEGNQDIRIESGWKRVLSQEFASPYFRELTARVRDEYSRPNNPCYPPGSRIFAAFDNTPFDQVKVVIMGQDPYHGPGQANHQFTRANEYLVAHGKTPIVW